MTVIKIQLSGAPNKNQENLASIPRPAKHKEVMTLKLEANKQHNISKMIFKSRTHSNGARAMVSSGLMLEKFNPRQTPARRQMSRSHPTHMRDLQQALTSAPPMQPRALWTFQGFNCLDEVL